MESKTVKGIVELVNPAYNSVKLKDGETYSGKFVSKKKNIIFNFNFLTWVLFYFIVYFHFCI
jgi:hypothetical protein